MTTLTELRWLHFPYVSINPVFRSECKHFRDRVRMRCLSLAVEDTGLR